jgi:Holliday junction resolvasome RuvABC ATP-dependent DNA helicase subunit
MPAPLRDRFPIQFHIDYYDDFEIAAMLRRNVGILWSLTEEQVEGLLKTPDGHQAIMSLARRSCGIPRFANRLLRRSLDYAVVTVMDAEEALAAGDTDTPDDVILASINMVAEGAPALTDELDALGDDNIAGWLPPLAPSATAFSDAADRESEPSTTAITAQYPFTLDIVKKAMKMEGVDKNGLTRQDRNVLCTMAKRFAGRSVGLSSIAAAVGDNVKNIEEVVEFKLVRLGYINREARGRTLTPDGMLVAALEAEGLTDY